jgi:fibronectin-binding autotransporter adhesin
MKLRQYSYIAAALLAASNINAATGTWNGTTTAVWDTSATNWTGVTGTPWDSTNGPTNDAIFNLASLNAKVTGTVFTNKITATLGGTLSGTTGVTDVITFSGSTPSVSVATNQILQLGTNTTNLGIAGSAGLTKTGAGILAIGGSSKAITGGIQVDAGTLRFSTGGGLGSNVITLGAASGTDNTILEWANNSTNTSNNAVTINSTGGTKTLQVTSGVTGSISALTLKGNVSKTSAGTLNVTGATSLDGGSRTITVDSGTLSLNGVVSQTASGYGITKAGAGLLVLANANTFTGGVTINAGTLRVTNNTALGTGTKNIDMQGTSRVFELSGGVTLGSNYTLRMSSNSGDGAGINSASGDNVIQGAINVTTGNPALNISSAGTSKLTIDGVIQLTATGRSLLFGGASTQANTVNGVISENSAAVLTVTKQGVGTWVFTNAGNSYKGVTSINGGILSVASIANGSFNSGIGASSNAATNLVFGGGTLRYTGATVVSDRAFTINDGVTGTVEVTDAETNLSFAGATSTATTGILAKTGAGSLTLTGANTNTGGTSIRNGSIILVGGNDRLATTGSVVLGDTGTSGRLVLGDGTARNQTLAGLTTTGLGGSVVGGASTNSVLTLNIASGTNTFGGTLGGAGTNENNLALTKNGAGKLTLTGTNTYTGVTTVSTGSLIVNGSIASTSVVVAADATLGGSGSLGSATLSGAGMVGPGNSPGVLTASTVDVTGGLDFSFEFNVANGMPTWNAPTGSGNDVLRLTGGTPFVGTMNSTNIINIYLNVGSLSVNDVFTGGFYTDVNADFMNVLSGATFNFFLKDGSGLVNYEGNTFTAYSGPLTFDIDTVATTANFGSGNVFGTSMQFTAVPESSVTLLGGLSAMLLLRRRRVK